LTCAVAPALSDAARTTILCLADAPIDWRVYITPALVLLSAVIAWLAMRNTRAVARQRATLDLIEKKESTEHYRILSRQFAELRQGAGFMHLVDPVEADKPVRKAVIDYLNHYEIVSIGILEGILDERIYRAWMEGAFVRDWNAVTDWIQRERWKLRDDKWEYRASIFENYQRVAGRWSNEARSINEKSSPPPTKAAGPGDEPLPIPIDDINLRL